MKTQKKRCIFDEKTANELINIVRNISDMPKEQIEELVRIVQLGDNNVIQLIMILKGILETHTIQNKEEDTQEGMVSNG